jgi:hypothetical protein
MTGGSDALDVPILSTTDQRRRAAHSATAYVIYRCYVCRLDLVLDTKHSKLTTPQRGDPNDDGDVAGRLVERGRILVRSYRRIKQKGPSHRRIEVT